MLFGLYFFEFFSGVYPANFLFGAPAHADPIDVTAGSLDALNNPPIIIVPSPPLNETYWISTNGAKEAFVYWYQFTNSTVHRFNIWEPVVVYWDLSNTYTIPPGAPKLIGIVVRAHAGALGTGTRTIYPPIPLNGTRPFISFSPVYFIPTVKTGPISQFLKPGNGTIISSYLPIQDANSPYATGPNAYQPGAGPFDVWSAIGSPETIINGIEFGGLAGLIAFLATYPPLYAFSHPRVKREVRLIRRDTLAYIATRTARKKR